MVVGALPASALEVVETKFVLEFTVVLFHPPARPRRGNEFGQGASTLQPCQLVKRGCGLLGGPFDQGDLFDAFGLRSLPPAVGCPQAKGGKASALRALTAVSPRHALPRRSGQRPGDGEQVLRLGREQGPTVRGPSSRHLGRHSKARFIRPTRGGPRHAQGVEEATSAQRRPPLEAAAVRLVGGHHPGGHLPAPRPVDESQGEGELALMDDLRRHTRLLAAGGVPGPTLGQIESPAKRLVGAVLLAGTVQAHGDLAVNLLAQRSAVLSCSLAECAPALGKLVSSMIPQSDGEKAVALARPSKSRSADHGLWLTNCCKAWSLWPRRVAIGSTLLRSPSSNKPRT